MKQFPLPEKRGEIPAFAAIDPGSAGAAIVLMTYEKLSGPVFNSLIIREPKETWVHGCLKMSNYVCGLKALGANLFNLDIQHVYCEYPAYFEKGRGAIAAAQGDLVKLACSVGAIITACDFAEIPLTFVEVMKWKGTMSKHATKQRIIRRLSNVDLSGITSHEWDAVGIGLFVRGEFKPDKEEFSGEEEIENGILELLGME